MKHYWMKFVTFNQEPGDGGGDAASAPAAPAVEVEGAPVKPADDAPESEWQAYSRKWEKVAKVNAAAAKELEALREAAKTEEQKQADRMAALEAKVKEYETRDQVKAWAAEIVKDSKVPAEALRGSTREDLEAHFNQIKALMPADEPAPKGAVAPYVATEGKSPAGDAPPNSASPGVGTLRAAYAASAASK